MEAVAPEDWPCASLTTIVDTDGLDDVQYRTAARYWLEGAADLLAGDLFARHAVGDEAVTANTYVGWEAGDNVDQTPYSPARIAQVLDQCVDRGRPTSILVTAEEESDNGFRVPGSPGESFAASLRVSTSIALPGVVSFHAAATYWALDGRIPGSVQERWLNACARFCEEVPITFGAVSSDDGVGETALDMALGRSQFESVRVSRSVLRGYSWVTICPQQIVERLGGAAKLEESEAFWRIRPLTSGATWMQATEHLEEYGVDVIRRVFRSFAPVLPEGPIESTWGNDWPNLVHADASQYRATEGKQDKLI
ncbi:hypothetical protein [Kribbella soli]|uniref:DUF3396 domain-containing protein n=1 Tax=Kribbella soli TaxID=1124743 RepID=A0A4V2LYE0_9ACTN|nr:hypothetical protein [Kribbella soli]TCC03976.1 hypothetical protein E0H45_33280 [Kribbella soli]